MDMNTYKSYKVAGGKRNITTFKKAAAMLKKDGGSLALWTVYDHKAVPGGYQVEYALKSRVCEHSKYWSR